MGRIPKKTAYWVAKMQEKARLQAQVEMQRKKPLDVSIKEHIGKILDNTKLSDIAEVAAAIGLTPIVKNLIETTASLASKAKSLFQAEAAFQMLPFTYFGIDPFSLFGVPGQEKPKKTDITLELFTWLMAFSIAYILVRHAGQLIGLLEKGLTSIVPLLMGVAI